jgi:hypothetical protein
MSDQALGWIVEVTDRAPPVQILPLAPPQGTGPVKSSARKKRG